MRDLGIGISKFRVRASKVGELELGQPMYL